MWIKYDNFFYYLNNDQCEVGLTLVQVKLGERAIYNSQSPSQMFEKVTDWEVKLNITGCVDIKIERNSSKLNEECFNE